MQLDLFGEVLAAEEAEVQAERARLRDCLTMLAQANPRSVEVLWHLRYWPEHARRDIGSSGDWAYSLRTTGLHFEHVDTWPGWDTTPRQVVTWAELEELLTAVPGRVEVITWARSVTQTHGVLAWRQLYRPYELWPHPQRWHPDYLDSDRQAAGWPERHQAWSATVQILGSVAETL